MNFQPILIICGHYGSGKTTFALNLAARMAEQRHVTLIDMDIVNPYFRSSDYTGELNQRGIRVIAPNFAGSTLDTPSLPPAIAGAIDEADDEHRVIIDAGGDDAGATALGVFAEQIRRYGYEMLYVINQKREQVSDTAGALEILREIEAASKLSCTGIVNNTHLCLETDTRCIVDSNTYADAVCAAAGLPLIYTCYPDFFGQGIEAEIPRPFAMSPVVRAPWMDTDKE